MNRDMVCILSKAELSGALPKRLLVLRWGDNPNANGKKVVVGEKLLRALENENCAFRTVALDFEHNTVPGTQAYKESAEPRVVAGYGQIVAEEGKGVFLEMERWTPEGEKFARHYEDLSAAPLCDAAGNVLAIASVALCRTGAVPGITFSPSPLSSEGPALPEPHQEQHQEKPQMDYKAILVGLLGLPADASDEAIAAKLEEAKKPAGAEPEPKNREPEPEGGVAPLAARVEALEKRADEAEKTAILAQARAEGKVVALAADALSKLTPAELKATVDATPATVPLSAQTPGAVKETPAKAEPTEQQQRVYALCGMTPEEVEKWA